MNTFVFIPQECQVQPFSGHLIKDWSNADEYIEEGQWNDSNQQTTSLDSFKSELV